MGDAVLPGNPPVAITLRRSGRARRISLRVSGLDGRVTLTLPPGVGADEALRFARSREDWIRGHLARRAAPVAVAPGAVLPVEGRGRRVVAGAVRSPVLQDAQLILPADRRSGAAAAAWVKELARQRLTAAVSRHAARLGRAPGRITLRDPRSRWGSCSSAGNVMFSWRLVLAPPEVLDYVAAHEVAHLAHMDHSPAFWAAVDRLYPGYADPRGWLRREGAGLHRWRFDD
ncbi:M48 family peptidase [Rhodobacteraceae bacterium CCMM004]|nr:M48 family peptidase [Rhodobacteraceae bacterium CCMM004]